MPSNKPLGNYYFFVVKNKFSNKDWDRQIDRIMDAGGDVTYDLGMATHVVVQLASGPRQQSWQWQCEHAHRAPTGVPQGSMSLPQILYAVKLHPHPQPKVVTPKYLDAWLNHGREPRHRGIRPVTLLGPKSTKVKGKPSAKTESKHANQINPKSVKAERMSSSGGASLAPKPIPWPLPASVATASTSHSSPTGPPKVFRDVGVCTFYPEAGCAAALDWLITCMGGSMDTAHRALYILVPNGKQTEVGLDKTRVHPSAVVLYEQFVFDCLKFGTFEDLDKYKVHAATPPPPAAFTTRESRPASAPATPAEPADTGSSPAQTTPNPKFDRYFSCPNPFVPAVSVPGKRQRDDNEVEESRHKLRVSISQRWKENVARAVKSERPGY